MPPVNAQRSKALLKTRRSLRRQLSYVSSKLSGTYYAIRGYRNAQTDPALEIVEVQAAAGIKRLDDILRRTVVLRDLTDQGYYDQAEALAAALDAALEAEKDWLDGYQTVLKRTQKRQELLELIFSGDLGGGTYHRQSLEYGMLVLRGSIMRHRGQAPLASGVEAAQAEVVRLRAMYHNPPYDAEALLAQVNKLEGRIVWLNLESARLHDVSK